uniref:Uncharacterized protein n=1 Tax=Eutreptiella gymnastica TaxID=73025 RepID=A0A7S1JHC7_9EUGL
MADPALLKTNRRQWEYLRDRVIALGDMPEAPVLDRGIMQCSILRRPASQVTEQQRHQAELALRTLQAQVYAINDRESSRRTFSHSNAPPPALNPQWSSAFQANAPQMSAHPSREAGVVGQHGSMRFCGNGVCEDCTIL